MKSFISLLLFLPALVFSLEDGFHRAASTKGEPYTPWFTGPILAPTPVNMRPGHPAIQPTVTIFDTYGSYNSHWKVKKEPKIWAINPLVDFQFGITDYLGIEIDIAFISNFQKGQSSTHFQDSWLFFGYQVSNDIKNSWVPDFRLLIQEIFPTGKYQKLDPKKVAIDSTGQGSYQTGIVLAFQKLLYPENHFFALHWSLAYLFFQSKVDVKGLNTYGGSLETKGKARPGQTLIGIISGEYSMNQNWVFAFDLQISHERKSHFSGKTGTAPVTLPASTQISISPGLEYNFNANNGLIFGTWFTLAGKNTNAFASLYGSYVHLF